MPQTASNITISGNQLQSKLAPTGISRIQGACSYYNGKIYTFAGWNGAYTNDTQIYTIATNTWTTGTAYPAGNATDVAATTLGQYIYAMGGYIGGAVNANRQYDTVGNSWATKAVMPGTRWGLACCLTIGNYIWVMGGANDAPNNTVWRYDPTGDSWVTTYTTMPASMARVGYCNVGTKIYICKGALYSYETTTDTWTTLTSVPFSTSFDNAVICGPNLFAYGNYLYTFPTSTIRLMFRYDINKDIWDIYNEWPTVYQRYFAAQVNNEIYFPNGNISDRTTPSNIGYKFSLPVS